MSVLLRSPSYGMQNKDLYVLKSLIRILYWCNSILFCINECGIARYWIPMKFYIWFHNWSEPTFKEKHWKWYTETVLTSPNLTLFLALVFLSFCLFVRLSFCLSAWQGKNVPANKDLMITSCYLQLLNVRFHFLALFSSLRGLSDHASSIAAFTSRSPGG